MARSLVELEKCI